MDGIVINILLNANSPPHPSPLPLGERDGVRGILFSFLLFSFLTQNDCPNNGCYEKDRNNLKREKILRKKDFTDGLYISTHLIRCIGTCLASGGFRHDRIDDPEKKEDHQHTSDYFRRKNL